jgi:hypothetical protein
MGAEDWEVGFVGLGSMGGAMVEAVLAGGYRVTVYDADPDALSASESRTWGWRSSSRGASGCPPRRPDWRAKCMASPCPKGSLRRISSRS